MAQQPPVGQSLLIIEVSQSHSDTPQSVGLLWTSDQLDAQTSACQHNTHDTKTPMSPVGVEPTIPASVRPQTHAFDRAATGIGFSALNFIRYSHFHFPSQYSDSLRLLPSCNTSNTFYCFLFLVQIQTLCKKIFLYPPLRTEDRRLSVV